MGGWLDRPAPVAAGLRSRATGHPIDGRRAAQCGARTAGAPARGRRQL